MIVTHKTVMPKTVMMGKSPEAAADADQGWVALGVITKPKGVRGRVRITSFTERSADLVAYGPLHDGPAGRVVELTLHETLKGGVVVASIAGVSDRDAAEALRGIELHVPRSALPEAESDQYYHADLVGLEVVGADGGTIGEVAAPRNGPITVSLLPIRAARAMAASWRKSAPTIRCSSMTTRSASRSTRSAPSIGSAMVLRRRTGSPCSWARPA